MSGQATCTFYLERNTRKTVWELIGREKGGRRHIPIIKPFRARRLE